MSLDEMRRELHEKFERLMERRSSLEYRVAEAPELTRYKPYAQKMVWMSPSRFLEIVPPPDLWSEGVLEYLKERMREGKELDPLFIDVYSDICEVYRHEGRHRARAAMELGIEKVPVVIYCSSPRGGYTAYSNCEHCNTKGLKRGRAR